MKVIIAFDRDSSRIGKTVDVTEAEARVLFAEGRARPAGKDATPPPSGPTVAPPLPEVIASRAEVAPAPPASP